MCAHIYEALGAHAKDDKWWQCHIIHTALFIRPVNEHRSAVFMAACALNVSLNLACVFTNVALNWEEKQNERYKRAPLGTDTQGEFISLSVSKTEQSLGRIVRLSLGVTATHGGTEAETRCHI